MKQQIFGYDTLNTRVGNGLIKENQRVESLMQVIMCCDLDKTFMQKVADR